MKKREFLELLSKHLEQMGQIICHCEYCQELLPYVDESEVHINEAVIICDNTKMHNKRCKCRIPSEFRLKDEYYPKCELYENKFEVVFEDGAILVKFRHWGNYGHWVCKDVCTAVVKAIKEKNNWDEAEFMEWLDMIGYKRWML